MPGLHKMNHAGLHFLRKLYENNPEMPFSQMLPIYNKEAKVRGWVCLRSSGTIGYHLTTMGLYQRGKSDVNAHHYEGNPAGVQQRYAGG